MEIRDIGPGHGCQVVVGSVVKVHGVKGELKLYPSSGKPDDFKLFRRILFSGEGAGYSSFDIRMVRVQGKFAVVSLSGIESREDAEGYVGSQALVEKNELPDPGPGCCYWHDLEGLQAVSSGGRVLGRVTELLLTKAHHILVIKDDYRDCEYMVPVHEQFIALQDVKQGILIITPPPGLLEMNE